MHAKHFGTTDHSDAVNELAGATIPLLFQEGNTLAS